jgi:hypothetical protein
MEGILYFILAWFVITLVFTPLKGRMMRFGEGLIYPALLMFAIAFLFRWAG